MAALGNYVIFFRVLHGTVRIERVLHGARSLPMLFGGDPNAARFEVVKPDGTQRR